MHTLHLLGSTCSRVPFSQALIGVNASISEVSTVTSMMPYATICHHNQYEILIQEWCTVLFKITEYIKITYSKIHAYLSKYKLHMRHTLSVLISSTPEHCSWLQRRVSSQKNERFFIFCYTCIAAA